MLEYSFISGDSFEDDSLIWSPSAGQLISEHNNLGWDTYAKGGQGNFYIFNSIITNIKRKDYKLALINWSSINRKDYITNFSNWQVDGYVTVLKIDNTHYSPTDQVLFESLNYIASAQLIFESLHIPYCMWWSINTVGQTKNKKCLELIDLIKSKNTFFKFDSSSYEYAKDIKHLSDFDNKHPDQEAHRRWGNQVMEYMDKQGIQIL
tara:strand:- start:126 stop:746 length:621 start_codon:yes stop_codon:yes gene_type:complete